MNEQVRPYYLIVFIAYHQEINKETGDKDPRGANVS